MDLDLCIQKRVVYIMKKKISICKVSQISIVLTAVIAVILSALSIFSLKEFSTLQQTTEQYILCENAAKQLQDGSDYLTEQVRHLAGTYNKVYLENQETQRLIRHQAEHDALTQALNRGSFEKLLHIYETGDPPFALILIDVDIFKSVNDTYGHAVGDSILKKVTNQLKTAFRSIDYVCRIGGDEFSVIMIEMTSNLKYTIEEKINAVNAELAKAEDGLPAISLSVGVAFSDRQNPSDSIFKDADKALYHVKENGRNGCWFY